MPEKCVRNIKTTILYTKWYVFLYSSRFWYKNYLALMHRYKALVHRQNLQERKPEFYADFESGEKYCKFETSQSIFVD